MNKGILVRTEGMNGVNVPVKEGKLILLNFYYLSYVNLKMYVSFNRIFHKSVR